MEHVFVDLPANYGKVYLYKRELTATGSLVKDRQVLWGDFLWVDEAHPFDEDAEWTMVVWHPNDAEKRRELKIRTEHVTDTRPLEIIFVDVGQGDGSILITPERDERERIMVIDAGEGDHMHEFLGRRFGGYRQQLLFHAAVITHPDKDHYLGFQKLFSSDMVRFENIYHNGLVERPEQFSWEQLGGLTEDPVSQRQYLHGLAVDHADIEAIFGAPVVVPAGKNKKLFPQVMRAALDNGSFTRADGSADSVNIRMLSTEHGDKDAEGNSWMPGFAPGDEVQYSIQVLGPVVESAADGAPRLRRLSGYGQTKNGHSVLLRLRYQDFTILFGGDLNSVAEKFLLKHYAGIDVWPRSDAGRAEMVETAADVFRSDVMKVCHHGAADVTDEFLETVKPGAFIISSGDAEGHVHPRPDLLGRLGKLGRGTSPVLLSTELQRSTREKEDAKLVAQLQEDIGKQVLSATAARTARIDKAIQALGGTNVLVDGAIYVKTDGKRLIAAFRIETGSQIKKWFYFGYEMKDGELELVKN